MGTEVEFDVTFSADDVKKVMEALMSRFKSGRDEPIKTVGLALTVAEIEVLLYKDLMSEYCVNLDEVIASLRLQAGQRALYLHKGR